MPEFDFSQFSAILPHVTAIVALIVPLITAKINANAAERARLSEMYISKVYDAMNEMAVTYSALPKASVSQYTREIVTEKIISDYSAFLAASYKVMSLISDTEIQKQITELQKSITHIGILVYEQDDVLFNKLMSDIVHYIDTIYPKKK